jgi:5'-nucleotidase
VPSDATMDSPWEMTRLSRRRFYLPTAPERNSWEEPGPTGYTRQPDNSVFAEDTDVYAVLVKRAVAVTPLSLDLTSRVDLKALEQQMRRE